MTMRWASRALVLLLVISAASAAGVLGHPALASAASFTSQPTASATYASGALAAPTGLACSTVVSSGPTLTWTAPAVTTPSLLRYSVLRRPDGNGAFTTIATGLTTTSYHDTPVLGSYDYEVSASYHLWTSPASAQLKVTLAVVLSFCS